MYCKHCGKQISDDSTFCQFCGGRVNVTPTQTSKETVDSNTEGDNKSVITSPEVIVSTKESSPLKIEVSKKGKDNSSTIANEIVGNLKMLGYAFGIFVFYMICFMAYRSHDARPLTEYGYLGESCYDPHVFTDNYMFNWEQHYAVSIYNSPYYNSAVIKKKDSTNVTYEDLASIKIPQRDVLEYSRIHSMDAESALKYANQMAKEKNIPQELLEEYKLEAKNNAQNDKDSFNMEISDIRKSCYEDDLKENAIYAAIISLVIMVFGRYLIKLIKWVKSNKT